MKDPPRMANEKNVLDFRSLSLLIICTELPEYVSEPGSISGKDGMQAYVHPDGLNVIRRGGSS